MRAAVIALLLWVATPAGAASANNIFIVAPTTASAEKAVFATVESPRVVPARARIGGTVAELAVKEGDEVALSQLIATVGDEKLALQLKSLDAQIAGLESQRVKAESDLARAEELVNKGTIPPTRLDEARTHRMGTSPCSRCVQAHDVGEPHRRRHEHFIGGSLDKEGVREGVNLLLGAQLRKFPAHPRSLHSAKSSRQ
jgi:multidrug resistance efflux pump